MMSHVPQNFGYGPASISREGGDVFGRTVNFAARVVGAIKDAEIWLSDEARSDLDGLGASRFEELHWERHDNVRLKGFKGSFRLGHSE